MNTQTAGYLVIFGIFTALLGLIAYQTHPENAPAALILGGSFGALLVFWGILGARGGRHGRLAALFTLVLLSLGCIWRAGVGWNAVADGQAERTFASLVVTLMFGVAIFLLWLILTDRKVDNTGKPVKRAP